MPREVAIHFVRILAGYFLAVLVAAATAILLSEGLPTVLPLGGGYASLRSFGSDFPSLMLVGSWITATQAFPGWFATAAISEWRSYRSGFWFAVAGVLDALLALYHAGIIGNPFFGHWRTIAACLFAGAIGGFVYWAFAGRNSGKW